MTDQRRGRRVDRQAAGNRSGENQEGQGNLGTGPAARALTEFASCLDILWRDFFTTLILQTTNLQACCLQTFADDPGQAEENIA